MRFQKRQVISVFLALLFTTYYGCITLFPHVHYIDNTPVAHSHPYSNPTHSHSSAAIQLLSELSHIVLTVPLLTAALLIFRNLTARLEERPVTTYFQREHPAHRLRGPPTVAA